MKENQDIMGRYRDISLRLREVRKITNLNQKDFAALIDVPYKSYSQWEGGDHRITVPPAMKIREKLGVSLDFIYCGSLEALPQSLISALASTPLESHSNKSNDTPEV